MYAERYAPASGPNPHPNAFSEVTRLKALPRLCSGTILRMMAQAVGKIPACVEACKCGALSFGDLENPESNVRKALASQFSIRRKPELGTEPGVYYLI